jgi:hypothetical protein
VALRHLHNIQETEKLACSHVFHSRTENTEISHYFIYEYGDVLLMYVQSEYMVASIFQKELSEPKH